MPTSVDSLVLNIKMASQRHTSRLLSPRPHLMGVGRFETINLFTAFSKLSFQTCTFIELTANEDDTLTADQSKAGLNTTTDEIDHKNLDNNTDVPKEVTAAQLCAEGTSRHAKEVTQGACAENLDPSLNTAITTECHEDPSLVIDRDSKGNETLIPYSFNKNTIRIFDIFKSLKIKFETEIYKPKEERLCVDPNVFYCKNVLIKDRRGQIYLVICHEETNINLKSLRKVLNAYRNFSFVTGEEMKFLLGTEPGGVTPLALMFANALNISMVISRTLYKEGASLMFHPLDCRLATKITMPSLLRYLKYVGHTVKNVD